MHTIKFSFTEADAVDIALTLHFADHWAADSFRETLPLTTQERMEEEDVWDSWEAASKFIAEVREEEEQKCT